MEAYGEEEEDGQQGGVHRTLRRMEVQGGGIIQGGWRWHTRMKMEMVYKEEDGGGLGGGVDKEDGGAKRQARG